MSVNNLPTITIGCPVSNRKYLINKYLNGIYNLDYPKNKIKIYFVLNNCRDGTDSELRDFKRSHESEYISITIDKYKMPNLKDKRIVGYRNKVFRRLAELRNYFISNIDTDYLFSVDSDIIVKPNVLKELVNAKKDIIAAVINNDSVLKPFNTYPKIRTNLLIDGAKEGEIVHYFDFPLNEIVEVHYTGAVYLLTREVCKNVKYDFSTYGEDIPFCANARKLGYKIYAHTGLWQNHIMCEYQNFCIENKCQRPCTQMNKNLVYQYRYFDNEVYPELSLCGKLIKGEKPLLIN